MIPGKTISIPSSLKGYVKQVWYFDGNSSHAVQFFADGNPGIVFQQSDTGAFACERPYKIPGSYIFGQTVKPITLNAPDNCIIIGVIFHPYVLQSLFRFSASEITDGYVDLNLLPAVPRINLKEQLWNTVLPDMQLQLIFKYLELLVGKNKSESDKSVAYAVNRIMQLKGVASMKKLQSELNLTERTFERKFNQHVGISPRLFSGITQFQASLQQLKSGRFEKLSDVAYDNGYADQSHFIRSFKKFTGVSPLQFYKNLTGYVDADSRIIS